MILESPRILYWEDESFSAAIDWSRFECAILESPPETKIVFQPEAETVRAEVYETGILFGPEAEVRWRKRRNGLFHVVVIDDRQTPAWPQGSVSTFLRPTEATEEGLPEQVLLWGEPRHGAAQPEWYDSRIPRVLTGYPRAFAGSRVAVEFAHYRLDVNVPLPLGRTERREVVVSRCRSVTAAVLKKES